MVGIVKIFELFYFVVIFVLQRIEGDKGYGVMVDKMVEFVFNQKGFLGVESVRDKDLGIIVLYWDFLELIKVWKENLVYIVV